MGCNPSKESQVATGNTVSARALEKKPSKAVAEVQVEDIADPKPHEGKGVGNAVENVEVKGVQENAANEEVEEGKLTEEDSPDPDFSQRKEEEAVHGIVTATTDGPKIEEVETMLEVEAGEVVEVENDVPVGKEEENVEEEEGEPSSVYGSVDLKETIFVEALNELEVTTTPEMTNGGGGAE